MALNTLDTINTNSIEHLRSILENLHPDLASKIEKVQNSRFFNDLNPNGLSALAMLIENSLDEGIDLNEIYDLLFNPMLPDEIDIANYREWHHAIYSEVAMALATHLEQSDNNMLVLGSGMYGGKSTLADEICRNLEQKGYKAYTLVPWFMNEKVVTVRGRSSNNGADNYEKEAIPINIDPNDTNYWMNIVQKIGDECPDGKFVIHFDEYSFMSPEHVEIILSALKNLNGKIILAGLDTDFLGRELPGFTVGNSMVNLSYECNSFVYGQGKSVEMPSPEGRMTVRYINIGDDEEELWIQDLGFAETVIPKGNSRVRYLPGRRIDHITQKLKDKGTLDCIQNPDVQEQQQQHRITRRLHLLNLLEKANKKAAEAASLES